jgi:hypothetical protein
LAVASHCPNEGTLATPNVLKDCVSKPRPSHRLTTLRLPLQQQLQRQPAGAFIHDSGARRVVDSWRSVRHDVFTAPGSPGCDVKVSTSCKTLADTRVQVWSPERAWVCGGTDDAELSRTLYVLSLMQAESVYLDVTSWRSLSIVTSLSKSSAVARSLGSTTIHVKYRHGLKSAIQIPDTVGWDRSGVTRKCFVAESLLRKWTAHASEVRRGACECTNGYQTLSSPCGKFPAHAFVIVW